MGVGNGDASNATFVFGCFDAVSEDFVLTSCRFFQASLFDEDADGVLVRHPCWVDMALHLERCWSSVDGSSRIASSRCGNTLPSCLRPLADDREFEIPWDTQSPHFDELVKFQESFHKIVVQEMGPQTVWQTSSEEWTCRGKWAIRQSVKQNVCQRARADAAHLVREILGPRAYSELCATERRFTP